jgi:tetratricopeptide (TPR) repeat protein
LLGLKQYVEALAIFEESYRICIDRGEKLGIGGALLGMGEIAFGQGDHQRAIDIIEESLSIHRELGHRWSIAHGLTALALAQANSDPQRAATLLAEADALYAALGMQRWALEAAEREAAVAVLETKDEGRRTKA